MLMPRIISALATLLCIASAPLAAQTVTGKVVRVADGDTITVLDSAKAQHKVRLEKIDAPEKGQAFGAVAKGHLAELVAGKAVRVEWEKRDKYGRVLGVVFVGETNANLQMVKDGYAWHYRRFDDTPEYAQAEKVARDKRLGLWADGKPIAPWDFRKLKQTQKGQ